MPVLCSSSRWLQSDPRLEVVLTFDRDEAGLKAADEWAPDVGGHRLTVCHLRAPYTDWATGAQLHSPRRFRR